MTSNKYPTVDLNADAGESFGPWRMGRDEEVFKEITSVNLACGFHAGDPLVMLRGIERAAELGVAVGAHPGFPDLGGFGRRDMSLADDELLALVAYQVGALASMLAAHGLKLHHVKAHGALYLQMAAKRTTADVVARAVAKVAPGVPLVVLGGPGGDHMRAAAEASGVPFVNEAFPDRAYDARGHLVPRSQPGALILDAATAAKRAVRMVKEGSVAALGGGNAKVEADTLCVHGDNEEALGIARALRSALEAAGVQIRAY